MFNQMSERSVSDKSGWQKISCVFFLFIVATSLSSCQTITRIKCNTKNWTKAGYKDGAAGKLAEETFRQYHYECSDAGATIDKSTYMSGHQQGLATFCTADTGASQALNGYENKGLCTAQFGNAFDDGFAKGLTELCNASGGQQFGLKGGIYRGTCSIEAQADFLTGFIPALEVALPQAIADVTILEGKLSWTRSDISSLEHDLSRYDSAIVRAVKKDNLFWEKQLRRHRSRAYDRLFRLKTEQRQINSEIEAARKRSTDIQNMLLEWKPELDAIPDDQSSNAES